MTLPSPLPVMTYRYLGTRNSSNPTSADRPFCAAMSAVTVGLAGEKIGGDFRGDMHAFAAYSRSLDAEFDQLWVTALHDAHTGLPAFRTWPSSVPCVVDGLTLDRYQVDAINQLSQVGGVLALDVGLGKTATALAAVMTRVVKPLTRLWIVCPLNAMAAWEDHRAWIIRELCADVTIVSMDSLHKYVGLAPITNSAIIFDEVHMLGSAKSRRTKAAHEVRRAFVDCVCLTGTLAHAGIENLLSVLDLACPGAAMFANKWTCGEYFGCLEKHMVGSREVTKLRNPPPERMAEFNKWLAPWVVALNKRSAAVVRSGVVIPEQITLPVMFPYTESLVQCAARSAMELYDADPDQGLPAMAAVMHKMAREGFAAKAAWLTATAVQSPDVLIVAFATYHDTLNAAQAQLEAAGVSICRVDGSVSAKDRQQILATWKSGAVYQVFLAQTDAASVSMNLQNASVSVMLDNTLRANAYAQALGRTNRRGSAHACAHMNLIANEFQKRTFAHVQAGADFNAGIAEWQEVKAGISSICIPPQDTP